MQVANIPVVYDGMRIVKMKAVVKVIGIAQENRKECEQ